MQQQGIIATVRAGSLAARLGLVPGDRLISVNDQSPQDLIDLSFAVADSRFTLTVEKADGTRETHLVKKRRSDDLGIEFESAVSSQIPSLVILPLMLRSDEQDSARPIGQEPP